VILDRCNVTRADRAQWLDVAFRPDGAEAVYFSASADECTRRAAARVNHPTIRHGGGARQVASHARQLEPPVGNSKEFAAVHMVDSFAASDALLLRLGCDPQRVAEASTPAVGFVKFPRTRHLKDMGGTAVTRDDLVLDAAGAARFLAARVTVEEKVDGANLGITIDPHTYEVRCQNRAHFVTDASARQFAGLAAWTEARAGDLFAVLDPPERFVLFGEWLRARHTVAYDALPDTFVAFDIFDRQRAAFLSRAAFRARLEGTAIATVPALAERRTFGSIAELEALLESRSRFVAADEGDAFKKSAAAPQTPRKVEGIYLRIDNEETGLLEERCKLVNADFVQSVEADGHWSKRNVELNQVVRN
jgi:atypical dual specificity phosphatase